MSSETEWINVNDAMPKPGDYALFVDATGDMRVLNKPTGHCLGLWEKRYGKWYGCVSYFKPTHWKKLPEFPIGRILDNEVL